MLVLVTCVHYTYDYSTPPVDLDVCTNERDPLDSIQNLNLENIFPLSTLRKRMLFSGASNCTTNEYMLFSGASNCTTNEYELETQEKPSK